MVLWKRFRDDSRGNFAVITAVAMVPLLGLAGLGVDYATILAKRGQLQEIADAAVIAVAKEKSLSSMSDERVQILLENYVSANYRAEIGEELKVKARDTGESNSVGVDLSLMWRPFFAHILNSSVLPLESGATATFSGGKSSVCILALNESDSKSLDMTNEALLEADGCAVFSNASAKDGISVNSKAMLAGSDIFTSGGYDGTLGSFNKQPITDAPPVADPLADRPAPVVGACDYNNFSATILNEPLKPGTYCGGLHLGGNVEAKLQPGIYVIKDGPLALTGNAGIFGTHVGFYFTGSSATFDFSVSSQVELTAPKTGPLSGILFFEDRASSEGRQFTIRSKDAERFEGVVYLPKGRLWIDKASRVGQQSNWTAIIANKIAIGKGPEIIVKSDYGASDVPVPEGIAEMTTIGLKK